MKRTNESKAPDRKKKRGLWFIPVILVLLIAIVGTIALVSDAPSRKELAALTIGEIDFDHLQDGTYTGSYNGTVGSLRDATVEVTITGGAVSDIRILKGAIDESGSPVEIGQGMSAYDLFQQVLSQKTLQVDVVSGATLTSNAHLNALENALNQALTAH